MIISTGYIETGAGGLITGTYSNGENVSFRFVIGVACETMTFTATVARAFAHFHIAGCRTGGVAFGKFSSAAEDMLFHVLALPERPGSRRPDREECGIIKFKSRITWGLKPARRRHI